MLPQFRSKSLEQLFPGGAGYNGVRYLKQYLVACDGVKIHTAFSKKSVQKFFAAYQMRTENQA
jgi:hypothetical protein